MSAFFISTKIIGYDKNDLPLKEVFFEKRNNRYSAQEYLGKNFTWISFFLCINEWAKSWIISILITISIIVHELGHLWVMKNLGANPKGFWFIPYLGAVAISSSNEKLTNWERWQIALMGPLWSLLFVMILYFSGNYIFKEVFSYSNELNLSRTLRIQHLEIERDFLKAVFLISGINLLNLLPLPPLDGGKMLEETIFSLSNN